ncbi:MAG: hypothetical protein WBP82_08505 [Leuconostoc mesenteroides]
MLSDAEIADGSAAATRLSSGKLTLSDVDELVSAFRTVLGSLEEKYVRFHDLVSDIEALDDTTDARKKARKMAACLIRLKNEDFGVATILSIDNSDEEQRKLFIVFALGLLYKIPDELSYLSSYAISILGRKTSSSVKLITVP